MDERVKVKVNCKQTSEQEGECQVDVEENGKQASCTFKMGETNNGVLLEVACTGDKELFQKFVQ
jgi:hypothetical protein